MFERKEKYKQHIVYFITNDDLRLKGKLPENKGMKPCFSILRNTQNKYIHHVLTPNILQMEYLSNIRLIVKELQKMLGKEVAMYKFNDSWIIRIPLQEKYNHNVLLCNFIRNIYCSVGGKKLIDYDYYYAGLAGKTEDVCPSEDGLYRLLFYQNKAVAKTTERYDRGNHNILYNPCRLYIYDEVKRIYKNSNIETMDLLKSK